MAVSTEESTFDFRGAKRTYNELSREYRRTVFMHDEWEQHRASLRFFENLKTFFGSGVTRQLSKQLTFVSFTALFVVVANAFLTGYTDITGVAHEAPLADLGKAIGPLQVQGLFFSLTMPTLSLLLVFRANTGYARWNEARTLWGGIINKCRNVVRQGNTFFPDGPVGDFQRERLMVNTATFSRALKNFLRGPDDDKVFQGELYAHVVSGHMTREQADACMAASNRPMFCINAIGNIVREADLDEWHRAQLDGSITALADLTGANERIFKSPVPLTFTRHLSRFIAVFCILIPFGLWPVMGDYWNHWVVVPSTFVISFFLLGIEEIGITVEEPFSILPLEAFCNGAIAATMKEMIECTNAGAFGTFETSTRALTVSTTPRSPAPPAPSTAAPTSPPPAAPSPAQPSTSKPAFFRWSFARGRTPPEPEPSTASVTDEESPVDRTASKRSFFSKSSAPAPDTSKLDAATPSSVVADIAKAPSPTNPFSATIPASTRGDDPSAPLQAEPESFSREEKLARPPSGLVGEIDQATALTIAERVDSGESIEPKLRETQTPSPWGVFRKTQ
ncbi:MAG: hypothetical protein SGPRY_001147 [Prymnesium sp.]